jgi:hypothetical protein
MKEPTGVINARLPITLLARLQAFAATMKISPSAATRIVLQRGLAAWEKDVGEQLVSHTRFLHRRVERPGRFVYFIRAAKTGAIKIGFSKIDPACRLKQIQVSTPEPLELLAHIAGGPRKERALHRRFAALRIRGEWFRPESELLAFVREAKKRQAG